MQHQEKTLPKMVEPLKTGELLVKEGLIRQEDIHMALSIQEKKQDSLSLKKTRFLGMILCDLNLITPVDNYYVLHKYNKLKSIQSALVSKHVISNAVFLKTEKESRQKNLPFISLLLETGLVSTSGMQRLLFDLFHIPFRSISDFIFNSKNSKTLGQVLDKHRSWEHRLIPLVLKNNTILFGITDPENILYLRKLNALFPQYRFKALFIPFSGFLDVYKIIYETRRAEPVSKEKPLDLSLLLSFKTAVKDPAKENKTIQTLYERYELLRQLIGNSKRNDLGREFNEFITQTHKSITREYKNKSIEFSLRKEDKNVKLIAFPKI